MASSEDLTWEKSSASVTLLNRDCTPPPVFFFFFSSGSASPAPAFALIPPTPAPAILPEHLETGTLAGSLTEGQQALEDERGRALELAAMADRRPLRWLLLLLLLVLPLWRSSRLF